MSQSQLPLPPEQQTVSIFSPPLQETVGQKRAYKGLVTAVSKWNGTHIKAGTKLSKALVLGPSRTFGEPTVATRTIPEFLAGLNKVCPFIQDVSPEMKALFDQGVAVDTNVGEVPPPGYTFLANPGGGTEWWAAPELSEYLFTGGKPLYRFVAKSVERVLKYTGSFVMSDEAKALTKALLVPYTAADLEYIAGISYAKLCDGQNLARKSVLEGLIKKGGVARLLGTMGLLKGAFIALDDRMFPEGVDVLPSEIKSQITRTDGKTIAYRPGKEFKSTPDSTLGMQMILSLLGPEAKSPEFMEWCNNALQKIQDNFEEYKEKALGEESLLDVDLEEEEMGELSRSLAIVRAMKAQKIHYAATPEGTNAVLNKLQKDCNPEKLTYPGGGEVMAGYPQTSPVGALCALWEKAGQGDKTPEELKKLKLWESLAIRFRVVDRKVRVQIYVTQKFAKKFGITDGELMVGARIPTGTTSGCIAEFRIIPDEIADLYKQIGWAMDLTVLPCPEVFETLWAKNEGGDLDDCMWWLRGLLCNLAIKGMKSRDEFMAKNQPEVDKLLLRLEKWAKEELPNSLLGKESLPGIVEVLSGYFDVEYQWTAVGLSRTILVRRHLREIIVPEALTEAPVPAKSGDLWLAAMRHPGNPFGPTVGESANAVMYGAGIRNGWVQVHPLAAKMRDAIACALMGADVSLCVDAANTGEKFKDAWESTQRTRLVLLWLAHLEITRPTGDDNVREILKPLQSRCGNSLSALTKVATSWEFEENADGHLIYAEDGLPAVTASKPLIKVYGVGEFTANRKFRHHPIYQLGLDHFEWIQEKMVSELEAGRDDKRLAYMIQGLETHTKANPTARVIAGNAIRNAFGTPVPEYGDKTRTEELARRYRVLSDIRESGARDQKQLRQIRNWVNIPQNMAFKVAYWECVSEIRNLGLDLEGSKKMMDMCLKSMSSCLLGNLTRNVEISKDSGRLVARRQGWSSAFRTNSKVPLYRGPWSVMEQWMLEFAKESQYEALIARKSCTAVFRVGLAAQEAGIKPEDLLGQDIAQILSRQGLSLVQGKDSSLQDPHIAQLVDAWFEGRVGKLQKEEESKLKGMTRWEIAIHLGFDTRVLETVPGRALKVTETTTMTTKKDGSLSKNVFYVAEMGTTTPPGPSFSDEEIALAKQLILEELKDQVIFPSRLGEVLGIPCPSAKVLFELLQDEGFLQ